MTLSAELIWLSLGIVLIFAEFFVPNLVIAFFGGGALVAAFTTWIGLTPSLTLQIMVFIVFSILFLVFLRKYFKRIFLGQLQDKDESQNFNVEIGKIIPVVEFIEPGEVGGKVKYQGTIWQAKASESITPGESARITGCENITLLVEKVTKEEKK